MLSNAGKLLGMKAINTDKIIFVVLAVLLILQYIPLLPKETVNIFLFAVSVLATLPVIKSAAESVGNRKISVDLLASVALVASLLAREWSSAAFINLMLTSARIFGDYTESKARAAIEGLLKLRPEKIKVRRDNKISEIHIENVKVGDIVIIEAGERIPVDGEIIQGDASIDQSSLTGESVPIAKTIGDKVLSSTLNVSGSFEVRAEKIGKDTTLEKIITLVEESQKEKSDIRTYADKFAGWYIGLSMSGAILIYLFTNSINLVLAVLLVVCADDIAVAVPLAFYSAIGYAARRGVIIKGGKFLEGLTKVKTIVVDKTGTLTMGKLKVQKIVPLNDEKENEVISIAASSEFLSRHPAAKAIIQYAAQKKVSFKKPDDFQEKPGRGTIAFCGSEKYTSGNPKFFSESKIEMPTGTLGKIKEYESEGFGVTLIGKNKKIVGLAILADQLRPGVKETIEATRQLGVKHWVMLTGDNEKVAERVAGELGIGEFHANLVPEDKVEFVKHHLVSSASLAMVGDGVNDAASLALADVGIAMGAIGSDAAIEAADIALMRDDIRELPETMKLGQYVIKIARQDFIIWAVTNSTGLVLVFSGIIGPEGAAAYNFITDFFPLLNSLRLFNLHLSLKDGKK